MNSNWELLMYLGLGIVGGLGATLFVKTLYFAEDLFDNWKFPPYLKPAVGGLGLGLVGYFLPQVFGTGFETIGDVLAGRVGLAILLLLILGKILAMALTLGSGASGGVFCPALFTGAVLGGAYGQVMQMAFPGVPAPSGAYAMGHGGRFRRCGQGADHSHSHPVRDDARLPHHPAADVRHCGQHSAGQLDGAGERVYPQVEAARYRPAAAA